MTTSPHGPQGSNRRDFLKQGTAALLGTGLLSTDLSAATPSPRSSSIAAENRKPGSRDWQLTRMRLDKAGGYRSPDIEGYCSRQSVAAGESLAFMVSTRKATRFTVEIYRTGYYGGLGARLMTVLGPFAGHKQPDPPIGKHRLRECRWEPSTVITIPDDWISGVYLGRLTTLSERSDEPYWQSYVIFIVRDSRKADILVQCSDNNWQAYNRWPNDFSLYTDARGVHARDVAVSFDRPYGRVEVVHRGVHPLTAGSGEWLCFEFPFAYWLEQHGYDVTYCSNSDCLAPAAITRCQTFVSVGHDEYWDVRQYHAIKEAIEEGTNVLWLSGNSVFCVSPFTPAWDGRPNRIITRDGHYGGLTDEEVAGGKRWLTEEFKRAGPDERLIIGARTITPPNGGGDWICAKPEHWIFAGTGMRKGDSIPGLVGWEYHGDPAGLPGLEVVAEGTAWQSGVQPAHWTATIFPGPMGNFVFNAATIFWVQGLSTPPGHILPWSHGSRPHGPDLRVQRITENLLARASRTNPASK